MPIEFGLVTGGDEKRILGYIPPGGLGSFSNSTETSRDTVVAHCLPDDSGSVVYRIAEADARKDFRSQPILLGALALREPAATLAPGETYECDITSKTPTPIRLVLTHLLNS